MKIFFWLSNPAFVYLPQFPLFRNRKKQSGQESISFFTFMKIQFLPDFYLQNSGSSPYSSFTLKLGSCQNRISFQKFRFRFYRNRIWGNKFLFRLKEPECCLRKSGFSSGFFLVLSGRNLPSWERSWKILHIPFVGPGGRVHCSKLFQFLVSFRATLYL